MANINTSSSAKAWSPDVAVHHSQDVVPEALILQTATLAGSIEGDEPSVRVAYVDDASAQFSAEGAAIPEAEPELNEILVHTGKISQLIRVTREQFHQEGTAQQLSDSVRRSILRKANEAYLTQVAPTSQAVTPPAGLLNVTGIENGDEISTDLDPLVDLIAALESNGATPSHIVVDPTGWATLRKIKTGTGSNASLLGAGTNDAERRLLDLPVLVSPAISAGSGVIIDKSATIAAAGDILVAASEHAYFETDSIGLRATWRIGWNVVRPDRLGAFTIAAE